ncbi:hypothetical protein P423_07895 [Escherichia coli JJ1886]|nr:hypothetical protein P423_07895 [Escherichia coli JJ1886]
MLWIRIIQFKKKARTTVRACLLMCWKISSNAMAQQKIKSVTIKAYNPRRITYRKLKV